MKKILVIIAASLITLTASAQKMGVIGGFTSSNASLKNFESSSVALYHFGIVANFPVAEGLCLQPEILYNVKGTSLDQVASLGLKESEVNMKAGYVEAGLQAQLGIGTKIGRIYGFAEPFLGYNVSDKIIITKKDFVDFKDFYSKIEYGLALGAGLELSKHFQVSAKYYWNLGKLQASGDGAAKETVVSGINQIFDGANNFNGVALSLAIFF